eukprot:gene15285-16862_t
MLPFCPVNDTLVNIWKNSGFSRCFIETLSPSILLLLIAIISILQLRRYLKCKKAKRYRCLQVQNGKGDAVEFENISPHCKKSYFKGFAFTELPRPFLYVCQWLLHGILLLLPMVDLLTRLIICPSCLHGSVLYQDIILIVIWGMALQNLQRERKIFYRAHIKHHSFLFIVFWTLSLLVDIFALVSWNNKLWWFVDHGTSLKLMELFMFSIRFASNVLLFPLGFYAPGLYKERRVPVEGEEQQGKESQKKSPFADFWEKSKRLWPFLWPKDRWLQARVLICLLLLAAGRGINVLVPLQYKKIVNYLSNIGVEKTYAPFTLISVYVVLSFLQGGGIGSMGLLNNIRSFVWINVQQYTSKAVQVQLFSHLHSLSLRWHLSRKTGEVIRMVDRGATSIDSLLSYILFQILPTIADIVVAVVFFATAFNGWFALIVFVTMLLYLIATITITEWRTKFRRDMNEKDNKTKAKAVDSLLNFETVKYYNNEAFEVDRYTEAIEDYQNCQWKALATLNLLNTAQNVVITIGLVIGLLYCSHLVMMGRLEVGDFVMFLTYMRQLYMPLNYFGTYYRMIQVAFIDMENMFDLLKEEVEIKDADDVSMLQLSTGKVQFRNVSFGYDPSRLILKDVSFNVPSGHTVALVGPSGSGKSTIIRLLFRFYDVYSGSITIDNQNVTNVSQSSLRQHIGVVPQDTVLFNDTVRYNIRYGRVDAEAEEVNQAAQAADIHDKIVTLKDGYNTIVGERGLKLSGGEKQRVAIARTILKAPSIVLLDEATSALDTKTERNIQASLDEVCSNRTTIIVAHRLSTIVHADQILVLKDGEIVERGRHEELLALNNLYAEMWMQQLQSAADNSDSRSSEDEPSSD